MYTEISKNNIKQLVLANPQFFLKKRSKYVTENSTYDEFEKYDFDRKKIRNFSIFYKLVEESVIKQVGSKIKQGTAYIIQLTKNIFGAILNSGKRFYKSRFFTLYRVLLLDMYTKMNVMALSVVIGLFARFAILAYMGLSFTAIMAGSFTSLSGAGIAVAFMLGPSWIAFWLIMFFSVIILRMNPEVERTITSFSKQFTRVTDLLGRKFEVVKYLNKDMSDAYVTSLDIECNDSKDAKGMTLCGLRKYVNLVSVNAVLPISIFYYKYLKEYHPNSIVGVTKLSELFQTTIHGELLLANKSKTPIDETLLLADASRFWELYLKLLDEMTLKDQAFKSKVLTFINKEFEEKIKQPA